MPVGVFVCLQDSESCLGAIIAVSNKVYTALPELVCHYSHYCHSGALVKYFPLDIGNRMLRICCLQTHQCSIIGNLSFSSLTPFLDINNYIIVYFVLLLLNVC